jgi:predicted nucleic acid-binding protein
VDEQPVSGMKPSVYLETTIVSYLTARLSRDLVVGAHQKITTEWWERHKHRFDLFVSEVVLREAGRGDTKTAALRLQELERLRVLDVNQEARNLAKHLLERGLLPPKAVEDALHVATATAHGLDYLLTWNCRHIANAEIARRLADLCEELGYEMPVLCTPEQLMGD